MKYLIFDFDGVLGDTNNSRTKVIQKMESISEEEVSLFGNQYFTQSPHTRNSNLSKESLLAMKDWSTRFGNLLHQEGFELFSDFIEELKKITDVKMAVVSSGSSVYIKPRLEKCGVEFTHILSFEDHHSKEEKVETICKDWKITVKDAYFFTDTISDIKELETIMDKDKIYGCAWGYQGKDKLSTVLEQNHILNNFSDIQKIFGK